jgi:hypothetical protein
MKRPKVNDNVQQEINESRIASQNAKMRWQSCQDASKSLSCCKATESSASFQKLLIELRHLIWEETFSQPRFFDSDTLRLLNSQNGTIYSLLTPSALYVCRESRIFAQDRLYCTYLFRTWPANTGRIIYFNPKCDVCNYRFTDLTWRWDFIPNRCLFRYIEIIANANPKELTDTIGYGLRSTQFHDKFPNLKRLVVMDRYVNLRKEVLRNRWLEERWNRESKSNQSNWDREWKSVQELFEKRNILITTSSAVPDIQRRRIADIAQRDVFMDTHATGLPSKSRPPSLISTVFTDDNETRDDDWNCETDWGYQADWERNASDDEPDVGDDDEFWGKGNDGRNDGERGGEPRDLDIQGYFAGSDATFTSSLLLEFEGVMQDER